MERSTSGSKLPPPKRPPPPKFSSTSASSSPAHKKDTVPKQSTGQQQKQPPPARPTTGPQRTATNKTRSTENLSKLTPPAPPPPYSNSTSPRKTFADNYKGSPTSNGLNVPAGNDFISTPSPVRPKRGIKVKKLESHHTPPVTSPLPRRSNFPPSHYSPSPIIHSLTPPPLPSQSARPPRTIDMRDINTTTPVPTLATQKGSPNLPIRSLTARPTPPYKVTGFDKKHNSDIHSRTLPKRNLYASSHDHVIIKPRSNSSIFDSSSEASDDIYAIPYSHNTNNQKSSGGNSTVLPYAMSSGLFGSDSNTSSTPPYSDPAYAEVGEIVDKGMTSNGAALPKENRYYQPLQQMTKDTFDVASSENEEYMYCTPGHIVGSRKSSLMEDVYVTMHDPSLENIYSEPNGVPNNGVSSGAVVEHCSSGDMIPKGGNVYCQPVQNDGVSNSDGEYQALRPVVVSVISEEDIYTIPQSTTTTHKVGNHTTGEDCYANLSTSMTIGSHTPTSSSYTADELDTTDVLTTDDHYMSIKRAEHTESIYQELGPRGGGGEERGKGGAMNCKIEHSAVASNKELLSDNIYANV